MKTFLSIIFNRLPSFRLYSLLIFGLWSGLYFPEPLSEQKYTEENEEISFQPGTLAEESTFMEVADINQDGKPDMVTTHQQQENLSWYLNKGNGSFEKRDIAQPVAPARIVRVADINGDNIPDIIAGLDVLVCYYGNKALTFDSYDIVAEGSFNIYDIQTEDLDRDGDQDILIASQTKNQMLWFRNDGQGKFTRQTLSVQSPYGIISLATPDLNGDQLPDIVCAYREISNDRRSSVHAVSPDIYRQYDDDDDDEGDDDDEEDEGDDDEGDDDDDEDKKDKEDKEDKEDKKDKEEKKDKEDKEDNDQNGDHEEDAGDQDEDKEENQEGGQQEEENTDEEDGNGQNQEEDSGNQQDDDEDHGGNDTEEEEDNSGNEGQEEEQDKPEQDIHRIVYFLNQGGGKFTKEVVLTEALSHPESVVAADLDGDGKTDILSASTDDQRVAWFRNLSGTASSSLFGTVNTVSTQLTGVKDAVAADIDADGDLDIVAGTFNGENKRLVWFENNGSGSFSSQEHLIGKEHIRWLAAVDIDANGSQDILAANPYQPQKILLFTNQSEVVAAPVISSLSPRSTEADSILTIQGLHFGADKEALNLTIGPASSEIVEVNASGNLLKAKVPLLPPGLYTVQLTVNGKTATAEAQLAIRPRLLSLLPEQGRPGMELKLIGKNIQSETNDIKVRMGTTTIEEDVFVNVRNAEIRVQIPDDLSPGSYPVTLLVNEQSSNSLNFRIVEDAVAEHKDRTPPVFLSSNLEELTLDKDTLSVRVRIEDDSSALDKVILRYGSITQPLLQDVVVQEPDTHLYELSQEIPAGQADELGLRLHVTAANTAGLSDTLRHTIYRNYQLDNTVLYATGAGTPEQDDYRIIAMPFESQSVADAWIGDIMQEYDKKQWRLFRFRNGQYEEYQQAGFSSFVPGEGYMFIQKAFSFDVEGQAAHLDNEEEAYINVSLQPGWNLIGNPFPFAIDWQAVEAANPDVAVPQPPKTFRNGSYSNAEMLEAFEGAFVKNEGSAAILRIPVSARIPAEAASRRSVAGKPHGRNTIGSASWWADLHISGKGMSNHISGFGMHYEAREGADAYDDYAVPRFQHYLDITFSGQALSGEKVARSIVPLQNSYVWSFDVNSSRTGQEVQLAWDEQLLQHSGMKCMLLDLKNNQVVDMALQRVYRFTPDGETHSFRIYYGSAEAVAEQMAPDQVWIGEAFPNPAVDGIQIPVALPRHEQPYGLQLDIFDQQGSLVYTLHLEQLAAGFHTLHWNRLDRNGRLLPAGLYLYRVSIAGQEQVFSGKVLLH